jgi:tetratricopeptide (TPR) repeat protein
MSLLAATQIPKPSDEQAFERASVVLWRGLLNDPNIQRNGRRGQRQNGVDLFGVRNGNPVHRVGIQCKLKSDGQHLTADEVREEVRKALTFRPELREYFIITTAPDDVALQELARELSADQAAKGRNILIYVWGWNTLEERISEDAAARKQFDPDYGAFSERILDETAKVVVVQEETRTEMSAGFSQLTATLARVEATLHRPPGDSTTVQSVLEAQLDAEIDAYREIANQGKPTTAQPLLEALLARIGGSASGRILFRVKANIGACLLAFCEDDRAAELFAEAYEHAPSEPKAVANKAFALLLQGRWSELLSFGAEALAADPSNEGLAGYVVQAARFDPSIQDPLLLVPEGLRQSLAVKIGLVDLLRFRGRIPEWWEAARLARAAYPGDIHATEFAAEADLDEILRDDEFHHTLLFKPGDRARVEAAAAVLQQLWDKARTSEGKLRPEQTALCGNLIVAYHAVRDLPRAIAIARQGLALAPNDVEIATRAAVAAIDGHDEALAREALARLPPGPDATVLAFRFHAQQGDWAAVAELARQDATCIPDVERPIITAAARLAEIKLAPGPQMAEQIKAVGAQVAEDARASIVVADFAQMAGIDDIAEEAFRAALARIDGQSHIAGRLMVAMHAARRGTWASVADLLDGHVAEDQDSQELRALATALVNDSPVRQRALRFFERLPRPVRELPFYLHAEGLLHFNRGALKQAEEGLRRAIAVSRDLTNYLALFATLRRRERRSEVRVILEALDPTTLEGTPGQKMYLAQEMQAAGMAAKAQAFAYDVLQAGRNDPEVALRYFGLMMLDPNGRTLPRMRRVGVGAWVRLEGTHGESHSFIVADGNDRPAEGILSPRHPIAAAAMGLKVGAGFTIASAFGDNAQWRVAEIKHKYIHALHDIMEHFQTRFPDAKGLYRITMHEGDVQPALDQVKRMSESNRQLADLYLRQHLPMVMVASRLGGDPIGFAEYIRSLDHDLEVCRGDEPERLAARETITHRRAGGAVLDTYTAWTLATMDALDVLVAVFGTVLAPQSVLDELRILRDKEVWSGGPSMTVSWQNGKFVRQDHTPEDIEGRRRFIGEQIEKIERVCRIEASTAPDVPTKVAAFLTETFGYHVLDSANLARDGAVLVAEDRYFRELAEAAVAVRSVWLQPIFAFATDEGLITRERYADLIVKLAWRRHGHLALDEGTLLGVLAADQLPGLANFQAVTRFMGTERAEIRSHITVASSFLEHIWTTEDIPRAAVKAATGIVLRQLCRFRKSDWAVLLALLKEGAPDAMRDYMAQWEVGHFLPTADLQAADQQLAAFQIQLLTRSLARQRRKSLTTTNWPRP